MKSFRKSLPVAPIALVMRALMTLSLAMLIATAASAQTPSNAGANSSQPQITFAKDVVPILQAKCQDCHHAGGMAPMSLVTYNETRPWAAAMKQRVATRVMPPWHLDKTVGIQRFQNDLSLSDEQIATIVRWVDEGAPLGNPKDMPAPKQWPNEDGWQLAKQFGAPDLVIDSGSYTMAAHGQDVWWKPLSDLPITEPRWVRAVEIKPATPGGRRIMHHVLARLQQDEPDSRKTLFTGVDANSDGSGMLMEAILPDGSTRMLSYVDHFNFNWMTNYIYDDDAAPVLPAGTVLHITAWHDNTVNNPNNPDPNQWVGWGERTVDEMSHAWVNVTFITDEDYQSYVAKQKSQVASAAPSR